MKEYKIGKEITLVVKERQNDVEDRCKGCIFCYDDTCYNPTYNDWAEGFQCGAADRSDGKRVIFVEKGE